MAMYSMPNPDEEVEMNVLVPLSVRRWTKHHAIDQNTTMGEVVVTALKLYRREQEGESDPPPPGAAPIRLAA